MDFNEYLDAKKTGTKREITLFLLLALIVGVFTMGKSLMKPTVETAVNKPLEIMIISKQLDEPTKRVYLELSIRNMTKETQTITASEIQLTIDGTIYQSLSYIPKEKIKREAQDKIEKSYMEDFLFGQNESLSIESLNTIEGTVVFYIDQTNSSFISDEADYLFNQVSLLEIVNKSNQIIEITK